MKRKDWSKLPPGPAGPRGDEEVSWVFPDKIVEHLPAVLADAPPLRGEEARYAQALAVAEAADTDAKIRQAMIDGAKEANETLVRPLFQFRNYGRRLAHHWSTVSNEAAFGTDYFTRTAIAKSNILVPAPGETKCYYQDLDAGGDRLNSAHRYTITFARGATPPVQGFWSLSIYDERHFFVANSIDRFSVGTKNRDLRYAADGSLTVFVQSSMPADPGQRQNWLPAPTGDFSLHVRAYWPQAAVVDETWTPPAVTRL
jgi:hypothetical protein